MQNEDPIEGDESIENAADWWLCEMEEGLSPEREREFWQWLQQDPRHARIFAEAEQTQASLTNDLPGVRQALAARVARGTPSPRAPFRPVWWQGLAAALVLGAMIWGVQAYRTKPVSYLAEGAEPRRIALADGTVVDLNGHSELAAVMTGGERRITLRKGEAHFKVAPDKERPFVVTAGGVAVQAIGTAFNVRMGGEKVEVLVTEGRVEVKPVAALPEAKPSQLPLLEAGDHTEIATGYAQSVVPEIAKADASEIHTLLAWQDRMSRFSDVPLREMVERINRCNPTKLVLMDQSLGDERIGGVILLNQVDAFVKLLGRSGEITAERRDNEILLRRR